MVSKKYYKILTELIGEKEKLYQYVTVEDFYNSWISHVKALMGLGFYLNPQEYEELRLTVANLYRFVDKATANYVTIRIKKALRM